MRVKWYSDGAQRSMTGRVIQFLSVPPSNGDNERVMAVVLMDDPEGKLEGARLRTVNIRYLRVDPPDRL